MPRAVTSSHHFEKSVSMMMRGAGADDAPDDAAGDAAPATEPGSDVITAAAVTTTMTTAARVRLVVIGTLWQGSGVGAVRH